MHRWGMFRSCGYTNGDGAAKLIVDPYDNVPQGELPRCINDGGSDAAFERDGNWR